MLGGNLGSLLYGDVSVMYYLVLLKKRYIYGDVNIIGISLICETLRDSNSVAKLVVCHLIAKMSLQKKYAFCALI